MDTDVPRMPSVKNLHAVLDAIQKAAVPDAFGVDFLKDMGFTSSNDRSVIKVLKYLGMLDASGKPQNAYAEFMDNTKEEAKKRGFVETIFGRRLNLPDINAKRVQLRQYAERTAINAPMQGTAADIIKLAMIDVAKWIENESIDAVLVMQVHDELVLEVESSIAPEVGEKVRHIMESITKLSVPLIVDVGIGQSWEEAH